jgi:protein-S-isoprenylcysteine O-methyltransferase Ste14
MSIDSTDPGSQFPKPTRLVILAILGSYLVLAWLIWLAYQSHWTLGWIYVALLCGCSGIFKTSFLFWHPELWWRRVDVFLGTRSWDWGVVVALAAGMFAIVFIAVFDFDTPARLLEPRWLVGCAIFLSGWMFFTWCSFFNPFFDAMVRIQTDEGHCVIDKGPYSIIRHPGYVGFIATFLSTPLLLPSVWICVLSFVLALTFVIRTALEDRTLRAELSGYAEYSSRVRYRLIPGVW